jgi:hypothetical protein
LSAFDQETVQLQVFVRNGKRSGVVERRNKIATNARGAVTHAALNKDIEHSNPALRCTCQAKWVARKMCACVGLHVELLGPLTFPFVFNQ